MSALTSLPPAWQKSLLPLTLLVAWILFCYRDTALAMVAIWARSDTYAHAFIVPPIVLWLIWRQRQRILAEEPRASLLLAVPVVLTTFLWLLGELSAVNALTQFALVATLVCAILSLVGVEVGKRIAFPLAFLFFTVPIGEFMLPQLMQWTAAFTVSALRASGIPVYQEGLQFVIPSGSWSVVEACSGVRYIIASVTVGTLFAYITYTSWLRRLLFIAASIVVPVLANWLRAYLIVIIGHLSGNTLATGVDHLIYGWLFFGLIILIMFLIGARWAEPPAPRSGSLPAAGSTTRSAWPATLGIACIAAIGPLGFVAIDTADRAPVPQLGRLTLPSGWSEGDPVSSWRPAYANPASELQAGFSRDGQSVGVYVGYYRNQDYRSKLVTSTNVLVNSADPVWSVVARGQRQANIDGLPPRLMTAELLGRDSVPETRLLVWRWYWINGRLTSSDIEAKLYTALSRLRGEGDDSAVVMLYSARHDADVVLPLFASEAARPLAELLDRTRGAR